VLKLTSDSSDSESWPIAQAMLSSACSSPSSDLWRIC